ncbi:MAG TPA: glycosyltransferase family 2 protein [Pirellulales bacterium]|jgi:glycosyltransferase involved in cell wall biosynthesis|nr:glycosyltransferase family 2 protein [Pirellulales bacterium]
MEPLVSVLIPTYNRSQMLRRALGSVLTQSYPKLEVLVSDNHSTDNTHATIAEFVRCDPRVRHLQSPPGNTSAMLNIRNALTAATGKYAVVLADDDFFLDYRYIEEGVGILESRRVGLLVCDCVLGRPQREVTSLALDTVTPGRVFFLNYWRGKYSIPVISNLFDVKMARRCNPWNDPAILYADVELWLKMMTLTDVAYYGYPAVFYHFHGQNIVSRITLAMHRQNIRFIENAAQFAAPILGQPAILEWKKDMFVEYWQLLLKEGKWPGLKDLACFRAALGLEHDRLGSRRWLRLLEYMRRHYVRAAGVTLQRGKPSPTPASEDLQPSGF